MKHNGKWKFITAQKINFYFIISTFLANNQWDFDNRVQIIFRDRLNALEEDLYKVNSRGVSPEEFYEKGIYGARRYILKTPDSLIPKAQRTMKIMYYVDKVVKTICYGGLSYWLYTLILSLFNGANVITTIMKIVLCICLFVLWVLHSLWHTLERYFLPIYKKDQLRGIL